MPTAAMELHVAENMQNASAKPIIFGTTGLALSAVRHVHRRNIRFLQKT